ncbi:MAG TPA: hypothetical protein VFQ50_05350 [Flavobacterium sp.]|jgi:hypothetical protein|nr:hypothetical protein [Flavobacterium sp.]
MKLLTTLFSFILFLTAFAGYSQDFKCKKGNVLVDDVVWLKYDGCGGWDQMCSIMNLQGEEIIYLKKFPIENKKDAYYWTVKFLGTQQTLELDYGFGTINGALMKKFYTAHVVNDDGTLNVDKVERMVEKYGNPYSVNTTTNTIIIRDETPNSGVNINIGR